MSILRKIVFKNDFTKIKYKYNIYNVVFIRLELFNKDYKR